MFNSLYVIFYAAPKVYKTSIEKLTFKNTSNKRNDSDWTVKEFRGFVLEILFLFHFILFKRENLKVELKFYPLFH